MSLQKAVETKFGIKPKIKTGKPGDLTLTVNGNTVFAYRAEGKMPEIEELLRRIPA